MKNKELKLFVGGYYDDRKFEGYHFEGKTPFSKDIDTYTLSEALKLPFIENINEWYEDMYNVQFDKLKEEEKITALLSYIEHDEIAGLLYFNTEEEAEDFKNLILNEIEEIEEESILDRKEQDIYGNFIEVYVKK